MREQHSIYPFKLTVKGIIAEPLPEALRHQVVSIQPRQRRQQAHSQRVEQASATARLEVLLVEMLVPFVGEAEIQEKPMAPVLQEYLISAYLVYSAVESQFYHFPFIPDGSSSPLRLAYAVSSIE